MLQTLRNRRNRKGFTLAELLIVVAIIAVLVAIAVPLFVGALNDAEKRVGEANCRAVRAAAVNEILLDTTGKYKSEVTTSTATPKEKALQGPWYAYALVDTNGDVSDLKVSLADNNTLKLSAAANKVGDNGGWTKVDGKYQVVVKIVKLETA